MWTDATGRRERLLPGPFNSSESRTAFAKLEIETSPHSLTKREGMALSEMLHAYRDFALRHYRAPDGSSTGEFERIQVMIRHARTLYGELRASEFGSLAPKSLRQRFVNEGWSRKTVNQQVERLRRAFKWAASEELIPLETCQRLEQAPTHLSRRRTGFFEPLQFHVQPADPREQFLLERGAARVRGLHSGGDTEAAPV